MDINELQLFATKNFYLFFLLGEKCVVGHNLLGKGYGVVIDEVKYGNL